MTKYRFVIELSEKDLPISSAHSGYWCVAKGAFIEDRYTGKKHHASTERLQKAVREGRIPVPMLLRFQRAEWTTTDLDYVFQLATIGEVLYG